MNSFPFFQENQAVLNSSFVGFSTDSVLQTSSTFPSVLSLLPYMSVWSLFPFHLSPSPQSALTLSSSPSCPTWPSPRWPDSHSGSLWAWAPWPPPCWGTGCSPCHAVAATPALRGRGSPWLGDPRGPATDPVQLPSSGVLPSCESCLSSTHIYIFPGSQIRLATKL